MSENDNKSPLDDNKNEKDPYDFFKFVGPENDEKNKPNKNNGKRRFPFFGLLLLIFAVVAIVDVFVLAKSVALSNSWYHSYMPGIFMVT